MPGSLAPMRFQDPKTTVAGAALATSSIGRSPLLWDGINLESINSDFAYGFGTRRNYVSCPAFETAKTQNGEYAYLDTGATIAGLPLKGGGAKFSTSATDNDSAALQEGGVAGSSHVISLTAPTDFAFERRFRLDTIIETGAIIGMGEEGMAADNGCQVDDTGALADKDFIGLHIPMHVSAATGAIVWRKSGQAMVTGLASALVVVAGTFYKFGARYRALDHLLDFAINGRLVLQVDLDSVTAATFPFDQLLSAIMQIKTGEAGDKTAVCTWHETAQRF